MNSFFQMIISKNLLLVISLTLTTLLSAQIDKVKLSFEKNHYAIGRKYRGKLIDTYEEALKIGLSKENKKEDAFYSNNAVYLFNVGGGCFGASPHEISIELEDNIVKIIWIEPKEPCPKVGEAMSFYGKIIIPKIKHPNYKKLEFKYFNK